MRAQVLIVYLLLCSALTLKPLSHLDQQVKESSLLDPERAIELIASTTQFKGTSEEVEMRGTLANSASLVDATQNTVGQTFLIYKANDRYIKLIIKGVVNEEGQEPILEVKTLCAHKDLVQLMKPSNCVHNGLRKFVLSGAKILEYFGPKQ